MIIYIHQKIIYGVFSILLDILQKSGERDKDGQIELRIPNKEVKEIFESTVRKWFEDSARVTNRKDLFDAVWNKDADKATKEISTLLRMTISYYDYRENFYHASCRNLCRSRIIV